MSHITTKNNILISDLDALETACKDLGYELHRNERSFKAYTVQECEHFIRLDEDHYEVGLQRAKLDDAGRIEVDQHGAHWALCEDEWERDTMRVVNGIDCGALTQRYVLRSTEKVAAEQGLDLVQNTLADGSIEMVAVVAGGASW
jgi:hypothetical protein